MYNSRDYMHMVKKRGFEEILQVYKRDWDIEIFLP